MRVAVCASSIGVVTTWQSKRKSKMLQRSCAKSYTQIPLITLELPFLPSNLVTRQTVAFESALSADETDDMVAVFFVNTHAPITKSEIKGFDGLDRSECGHDSGMAK